MPVMSAQMQNPGPKVAVVTPVYNGESYLRETLECVQRQTYPNVVHVVRDNASSDATPDIIRQFADGPKRLIVSRASRTCSMVDNWNAALDLIPDDADYFRILCADDTMQPEGVAAMVEAAERHPTAGIVGCTVERGGRVEDPLWSPQEELIGGQRAIDLCLNGRGAIHGPHLIWRREVLNLRRPFFDPDIVEFDTESALFVLLYFDFAFVHRPLAFTRVHPERFTETQYRLTHDNFLSWLQIMERIGPQAIPPRRFRRLLTRYRMYHLRKLLYWRVVEGNRTAFQLHLQWMKRLGFRTDAWEFVRSLGDWALKRLGLAPGWSGHPY